jgi:hypothetical protein
MAIGLLVPDRPQTPSDGRAQVSNLLADTDLVFFNSFQHYRRPGETDKQQTRTFHNGTTLTFGIEVREPLI